MDASRFIAGRLRFQGKLASISIALSFFIIIIAVSVSSGFRKEIRSAIAYVSGDIQVCTPGMNIIGQDDPVKLSGTDIPSILDLKGVQSVNPVIYRAGIIKCDGTIQGVVFKGTEEDTVSLSARIPSRLSEMLSLDVGDSFVCYFVGERIKARKLKVAGIFPSVLDTRDAMVVYLPIGDLRRLNDWDEDSVSALEVILEDKHRGADEMGEITFLIGTMNEGLVASSAVQRYSRLFDWLDLLDMNVVLVLVLMTIVAGFNMISGLLILLFRNIKTIGILKSMGMGDKGIRRVFLRVSSNLILKGMAAGNALSLLFCLIQGKTHLLKLDPANYFIPYVPVSVDIPMILFADVAAFVVIMVLLLLPCIFIGKVDPSKTVRYQ